jgi:hypothetical protein
MGCTVLVVVGAGCVCGLVAADVCGSGDKWAAALASQLERQIMAATKAAPESFTTTMWIYGSVSV